MKRFILLFNLSLCALLSLPALAYAQSAFQVTGKTNMLTTGKAVLSKMVAKGGNGFQENYDTTLVRNQKFTFRSIANGVQRYRIILLDANGKQKLTEPIFLGAGNQRVSIDSLTEPHDFLDVGFGVAVDGSRYNDEYIHQYLAAYQKSDEQVKSFFERRRACSSIKDTAAKRGCLLQAESERLHLRKSRDSILYRYAEAHPASPIMPSILYAAISDHGYSEYYQGAFRLISPFTEPKMRNALQNSWQNKV